ncbi:MAG: DHH family phosphoesterase [Candidatus Eisenbacteria bacterium]
MRELEKTLRALEEDAPVLIASHVNPDGDSVGSSLGLATWLRGRGRDASAVFAGGLTAEYGFLPKTAAVLPSFPEDTTGMTAVIVDTPDPSRTGAPAGLFDGARSLVNIDHHPSNTMFGDVALVDVDASSTSLIVHELIEASGHAAGGDVATFLYVGVLTDTGGFRFGNTDARTFDGAAALVRAGADAAEAARHVYGEQPVGSLRLLGMVLSSAESELGGRVAVMTLTDEMRERSGAAGDEIEGLASYGHLLEGVEVSLLLREQDGKVRVSFRSSGRADVNAIAGRVGGGGHKAAAGALMEGPLEGARARLIEIVAEALERE